MLQELASPSKIRSPEDLESFERSTELACVSIETKLNWLNQYFANLEIGLAALASKKMSPLLIPPSKLRTVILDIVDKLGNNWYLASSPNRFDPNIYSIYASATVSSAMEQGCLKLFISIPVTKPRLDHLWDHRFVLYKMHSLPISVGHNISIRVIDLPPFFAVISRDGHFVERFLELSESQIKDCSLSIQPIYCNFHAPIAKRLQNSLGSCAMSLFTDDADGEKKWCRRQSVESAESETAVYLGARRWAIATRKPQSITYYCPDGTNKNMPSNTLFNLSALSIFRVPMGCTGFTDDWEFPSSYSGERDMIENANDVRLFTPISIMPNLTSGLYSAESYLKPDLVYREEVEKLLEKIASLDYLVQMFFYVIVPINCLALTCIVVYLCFIRTKMYSPMELPKMNHLIRNSDR